MIDKPKLIVMCGLQCSGKSTKALDLAEEYKAVLLSSDEIRKELPGANNNTVFEILHKRMNQQLEEGKNVIYDATNITNKSRRQLMQSIRVKCYKYCYIMNTPFDVCMSRLKTRNLDNNSHYVPEEVLEKYHKSFQIPFFNEGWDAIAQNTIVGTDESDRYLHSLLNMAKGFDQKNKHHTQSLGEHLEYATKKVIELVENIPVEKGAYLIQAAKYHDIGKLFTQTFDKEGQGHYYNHAEVGTYELLCKTNLPLQTLFYINYHMVLHNTTTEKSIAKWRSIFGNENYADLRLFEKADKSRPEDENES